MNNYKVNPRVRWVVERFTVTLTDGQGNVRTLRYPEAAIWDLLARGYQFAKVVSMITHIAWVDAQMADALVRSSIEDWAHSGFLEPI